MTPDQRIATAQRAKAAWDEFLAPIFDELHNTYADRLVEVANSELNPAKRCEKITALSNALKIVTNLENGMKAIISDGDVAMKESIRYDKVENMTAPARRLLNIGPF